MLGPWITKWRDMGYQVIVTADHGQDARGHHGGHDPLQQELRSIISGMRRLLKWIPAGSTSTGPTILSLLGAAIPDTMKAPVFLK